MVLIGFYRGFLMLKWHPNYCKSRPVVLRILRNLDRSGSYGDAWSHLDVIDVDDNPHGWSIANYFGMAVGAGACLLGLKMLVRKRAI